MQCRMCGFEFEEDKKCGACRNCGKCNFNLVHCPNCGYGNDPAYETEFKFVSSLKNKLKKFSKK